MLNRKFLVGVAIVSFMLFVHRSAHGAPTGLWSCGDCVEGAAQDDLGNGYYTPGYSIYRYEIDYRGAFAKWSEKKLSLGECLQERDADTEHCGQPFSSADTGGGAMVTNLETWNIPLALTSQASAATSGGKLCVFTTDPDSRYRIGKVGLLTVPNGVSCPVKGDSIPAGRVLKLTVAKAYRVHPETGFYGQVLDCDVMFGTNRVGTAGAEGDPGVSDQCLPNLIDLCSGELSTNCSLNLGSGTPTISMGQAFHPGTEVTRSGNELRVVFSPSDAKTVFEKLELPLSRDVKRFDSKDGRISMEVIRKGTKEPFSYRGWARANLGGSIAGPDATTIINETFTRSDTRATVTVSLRQRPDGVGAEDKATMVKALEHAPAYTKPFGGGNIIEIPGEFAIRTFQSSEVADGLMIPQGEPETTHVDFLFWLPRAPSH